MLKKWKRMSNHNGSKAYWWEIFVWNGSWIILNWSFLENLREKLLHNEPSLEVKREWNQIKTKGKSFVSRSHSPFYIPVNFNIVLFEYYILDILKILPRINILILPYIFPRINHFLNNSFSTYILNSFYWNRVSFSTISDKAFHLSHLFYSYRSLMCSFIPASSEEFETSHDILFQMYSSFL